MQFHIADVTRCKRTGTSTQFSQTSRSYSPLSTLTTTHQVVRPIMSKHRKDKYIWPSFQKLRESTSERALRQSAQAQARKRSENIDRAIEEERLKLRAEPKTKILLLGQFLPGILLCQRPPDAAQRRSLRIRKVNDTKELPDGLLAKHFPRPS